MKKIEIKEVGPKSAFKTTLYIASIPLAILLFIGIIATIIGATTENGTVLEMGVLYIMMPFFMLAIYGLVSMLVALVYNKFTSKFGGLELVITEKNDVKNRIEIGENKYKAENE